MPTSAGPNIAGESNIVFSYDIGDTKNSYRGEPTTNLLAAAGSDAAIERSGTGYPYYWANIDSVVQSNWSPSNNTLTFSFEGKRDYSVGGTGGGGDGYPVFYVYFTDWSWAAAYGIATYDWSYDEYTFTMPNPSGKTVYFSIYHMNAGNPGTSYSRNHQIEFKSHATQFVNGTRSATQGLLPLISNSTTNLSTVSFDSNAQITFDGTDDYITVPHNASQSFTGDFTIESVIYPTANTANCIIQKGPGSDFYQEYWLLQDMRGSSRYISLIMGKVGNSTANYIDTANISVLNTYHHIVATVSGNLATIYVNGEQRATGTISNRIQSTSDIRIGQRADGFAATSGLIPIVKLYNKALTTTEVKQNYQQYKTRFNLS